MKDVIQLVQQCLENKTPFALATVLKTWGSAPRKMGAHMVVASTGEIAGSVSGGCVEGDMARKSMEVIASQRPKLINYGVSNEDAWQVGLSCGGKIDVYLEPFLVEQTFSDDVSLLSEVVDSIKDKKAAIIIREISEEVVSRSLITEIDAAEEPLQEKCRQVIKEKRHLLVQNPNSNLFFEVLMPNSRLILVGASHIAADLVHFANQLGMETIVIDPRKFFADNTQFSSNPDQLIQDWPEEVMSDLEIDAFTYAVTLTHDPKIDDQALQKLLQTDVAYIGALGSRRTHEKRTNRLKAAGFDDTSIERIHGPVGLSINAQTAQEIALSIIGEIVQIKNQFL